MNIHAVAVLGRTNEPLFFHNFSAEWNDFDCQSLLFMSLDHLQEKMSANRGTEPFLGLYYFLDHLNFYAYSSASQVKVIVLLEWQEVPPKDQQMKSILHRLYSLYVNFHSNPFHEDGSRFNAHESQVFIQEITTLLNK